MEISEGSMIYEDIVDFFGSAYKAAKMMGFSKSTPYYWKRVGFIPIDSQLKIQTYSGGVLKASLNDLKKGK